MKIMRPFDHCMEHSTVPQGPEGSSNERTCVRRVVVVGRWVVVVGRWVVVVGRWVVVVGRWVVVVGAKYGGVD